MKKKLLIVFGVFILGIFILGLGWYLLIDVIMGKEYRKNFAKAEVEGQEFGKTVNDKGCITEGLKRVKGVGGFDIEKRVLLNTFVENCLRTSKSVDGFCDDVPSLLSLSEIEWEEEMCRKVGMPNDMVCEVVFDAKHTVCNFPKDKE
jgi:hypothetical protein